jgi:5-methylcytosine-specific restriction endonuclease McrA
MPIIRSGYATTPPRNGSTRQWRKARALVLNNAERCTICGQPPTDDDPLEAGHITPHAYGGTNNITNIQAQHRSCNRKRGALTGGVGRHQ